MALTVRGATRSEGRTLRSAVKTPYLGFVDSPGPNLSPLVFSVPLLQLLLQRWTKVS
jgi:hypothetical protein